MIHRRGEFRLGFSFASNRRCRVYSSSPSRWRPLPAILDGSLETFRREAFEPSIPALLTRGQFLGLPAIQKWFVRSGNDADRASLNHRYLEDFGAATVPLELTSLVGGARADGVKDTFQRAEVPFHMFLEWTKLATVDSSERLYLAQASFSRLPKALIEDLPTPEIVAKAGTGDIYDTNLWMGIAPTYTPLHRDPNPNLFVQLAGHKVVRLLPPDAGHGIFDRVQIALGKSGSAAFRSEEMMKGEEKKMLEAEIWDDNLQMNEDGDKGYHVHLWGADGLFIPKGWWHSIKGVDSGILASVNWWFR